MEEKKPLVMLVDDDTMLTDIFAHHLEQVDGVVCKRAASGDEAFAMLRAGDRPNLIIMDFTMPGLDGIETVAKIRSELGLTGIPIVIMSNYVRPQDVEGGNKLGVAKFVDKVNMTPADISDLVHSMLDSKE